MKLPNISQIGHNIHLWSVKHSPGLLTGLGIAGMITTTVFAIRATPKAIILLEKKKKEEEIEELKPIEVVKTTWTCYIPTIVSSAISIGCVIGANKINARRNAALAAAYSLSESALKTYQEKVIETIGEKKEHSIRDEIAKDKIHQDPIINREVIITGNGETLCYDTISCRYFKSDIEKIRKVEALLNKELFGSMYVSLNDFYFAIGLKPSEIGDDIGWNIDQAPIEFEFSSQLADNGMPCLVIGFQVAPRYEFRDLH